ncbi:MAG: hypothetical protein K0T01_2729, partial [Acidimicrobiia bacterium]|nr:hypothetical protein [Acidimicrobiia bacterium]
MPTDGLFERAEMGNKSQMQTRDVADILKKPI